MKNNQVLAVQLPAFCPLKCDFCRTPEHGTGDTDKILSTIDRTLKENPRIEEVYLTSNGETGLSPIFSDVVRKVIDSDKSVSVLCATAHSIVPGLKRVEISFNNFTQESAQKAVRKAKDFKIPIVLSVIDTGAGVDTKKLFDYFDVDGILVRALQAEGRSKKVAGKSFFIKKSNNMNMGIFPVIAYPELQYLGKTESVICINHFGEYVQYLGATA